MDPSKQPSMSLQGEEPLSHWVVPAIAIGLGCGIFGLIFNILLAVLYKALYWIPFPLALFIPLLGVWGMVKIQQRWPEAMGGGVSRALTYLHVRHNPIPLSLTLMKAVASLITLGTGIFAGKEGPAVFMGTGIGQNIGKHLKRRASVSGLIGSAAMFAALFKAPIGGTLFALEVPYKRFIRQQTFLPAILAAAMSYFVVISVQGPHPLLELPLRSHPDLTFFDLIICSLLGIVCGLVSRGFVFSFDFAFNFSFRFSRRGRLMVGGGAGTLLMALFYYMGREHLPETGAFFTPIKLVVLEGYSGELGRIIVLIIAAFVLPLCFEAFGFSGGFFAPCMLLGAALGSLFSGIFQPEHEYLYLYAGMGGVLAGVMKVPISAIVLVMELSGTETLIPLAVTSVISTMVAGEASVFHDQYVVSYDA